MVNSFKFSNEAFDKMFEAAASESDPDKRAELLVKCDQIVIDQAAIMPVLTDDHIVMINARVRDFAVSPMEVFSLTNVFIKEQRKDDTSEE
jgi:ABC-type transport system substrate-binding protein